MKCFEFLDAIHEFLDRRLSGRQMSAMESHLQSCPRCRETYEEFVAIRRELDVRVVMPEPGARRVLLNLKSAQGAGIRGLWPWLQGHAVDWWRALEPSVLWSKATATPMTLLFFAVLLSQLAPVKVERLAFLILSADAISASSVPNEHISRNFAVMQDQMEFKELMDTAWRLPYEDSLSLVAEVTPEGNVEIGSVLEYPKSYALLNAVNVALQESQVGPLRDVHDPFLIFSFQKIDVYEDGKGF